MVVLAKHSLARFCFDVIVLGKTYRQLSLVPNMSQITVSCFFVAKKPVTIATPRQSRSSMLSCLLERASWNMNCCDFVRMELL
jgi:hypothetical protein